MYKPDGSDPEDTRLMMTSPEIWSYWPLLPLRRVSGSGMPETAILYDRSDEDMNLKGEFRFLANSLIYLVTVEKMRESPIVDIDKLINDGWIVD